MGMRKAMTGLAFEERSYDHKHSHDDNFMSIPNLTDHKADLIAIPTLAPSTRVEYRFDKPDPHDISSKIAPAEEGVSRSRLMREAVKKISKLFNENHSKI